MKKQFVGYHGTLQKNVQSILTNGFKIHGYSFITSQLQKVPGDLGAGVYAYHDSKANAEKFARKFGEDVAILQLNLLVDDNRFLDMDEEENAQLIVDVYNSPIFKVLEQRYEHTNKSSASRKCLDGLILEHIIHKRQIKVDLVKKKTYTRFTDMPPISHYFNGTELCIKSKEIIESVKE